MQLDYNKNMAEAYEGMIATLENTNVKSGAAEVAVPFGFGVVQGADENQVSLPYVQIGAITFSADFVTGNVINGTVNGVAIAPVTFSVDQGTTLDHVIDAIDALSGVSAIYDSGRTIIVTSTENENIILSFVVTAGGSQATATYVYSSSEVFRGISVHTHKMANLTADTSIYAVGEAVGYLTKGPIWVPTVVAVVKDETAYVVVGGANAGKFTNVSSGNLATGGKFIRTVAAAGISIVEINNP